MIDPEDLAGFAAFGEEGPIYHDGHNRNYILLKIGKTCAYLTSAGEPAADGVKKVFREALAARPLIQVHKYLIDLTAYYGTIDWKAGNEVRELVTWQGAKYVAAYVVRDEAGAILAKSLARANAVSKIATFKTRQDAQVWLDTSEALDVEPHYRRASAPHSSFASS
ncbi:MAG: hypothetical protein P4L57_12295 [Rhizomicrobium sp.]|nr:hypothetical protein [Rhizomicrobium sp.]